MRPSRRTSMVYRLLQGAVLLGLAVALGCGKGAPRDEDARATNATKTENQTGGGRPDIQEQVAEPHDNGQQTAGRAMPALPPRPGDGGGAAMSPAPDGRAPVTAEALPALGVITQDQTEGKARGAAGNLGVVRDPQTDSLRSSEGQGAAKGKGKGQKDQARTDKPIRGPETWKRDRAHPTFARVYVGDGNALELVSLQVTVTVEGPRARTLVDHIFRNPHAKQLEGTFEYPLPTGASPSYFAMFLGQTRDAAPPRFAVRGQEQPLPQALARLAPAELVKHVDSTDWGTLREARIVEKKKALETYEEIVRGRIDPALLEYAGGNTFSGRVFPIPPKGYNRVLIAYEELLPVVQGKVLYRYALPDCKLTELQFTLQADPNECQAVVIHPEDVKTEEAGSRVAFRKTWRDHGPGGDVQFGFTPPAPEAQVVSGRQADSGPLYVYARVRPPIKTAAQAASANHAVFLLDISQSEHPDRFAVNMKLLRKILESDPDIKHFNILAFNVAATWIEPKGWLENTPAGREKLLALLDGVLLEGATNLAAALDKLAQPGFEIAKDTPLNVFLLSDGQLTWGETAVAALVAGFEGKCPQPTRFHCYRTGIGADNLELFEALTRRGGGIFNCYSEADLPAAASAHRHHGFQLDRVRFVGGPATSEVLVAGRKSAIYPSGELIVGAKVAGLGKTTLVLEGTFLGKKTVYEYPVDVTGKDELAARGWGEIAVASLQALNDPRLDSLIVAYAQQFAVGSRAASFLVLENEADYKRLNLEEERGKTVPGGDVGQFVEQAWQSMGKPVTAREAFDRFLARIEPNVKLLTGPNAAHVTKLLLLLADREFELPGTSLGGAITWVADADAAYRMARDKDRQSAAVYLNEGKRRVDAKDVDGAVRVLSSLIEEYPTRGDALRLVGYRLLDLKQPAQAARLFHQVQQSRPFEPHSYRDLAHSLEESGSYGLAALEYELVLAGTWHNRFGDSIKMVVHEEYARMMHDAIRQKAVSPAVANHFGERLEHLAAALPQSDLRVTISWNTDATDVDLWVIEPDGTKCFYSHAKTKNGGELSQDQTQGYGPERYHVRKALQGEYTILVHYYRANPNLLAGESHVNVVVTRFAGTPQEQVQRHTVILKQNNEQVEVCRVKF